MLTKGLPRPAIILSKYIVTAVIMTVSYWLCFGITYGYTAYLWANTDLQHTLFAAFSLWIIGFMYLSILSNGVCIVQAGVFRHYLFIGSNRDYIAL